MEPLWRIELFGGVRAIRGGTVVERFRTQKTAALLGFLAYHRRQHPREVLVEQFWSEDAHTAGRHNLSVALSSLRQQLEPPGVPDGAVLSTDRATTGLIAGSCRTDVADFEDALRAAANAPDDESKAGELQKAVALYREELLSGFYDTWIFPEQQRLSQRFVDALKQLIGLQLAKGHDEEALQTSLKAVAADPHSEPVHQEVMRRYLALDQPAAALRQYRELERLLREDLDLAPSLASFSLFKEAQSALAGPVAEESHRAGGPAFPAKQFEPPAPARAPLDSPEGAVPLDSPLYVVRSADEELATAVQRRASIVLVKGPRQIGKTSLLARGLVEARRQGASVISTDFQSLSVGDLQSPESLFRTLAQEIADQLDLEVNPSDAWQGERSANSGFRRFLRKDVLEAVGRHLVWGLDEVDRLFAYDYHSEVFGLFRSWHNQRALDPAGPWGRLTLIIAYATEAHLFITDPNQSPFNVGTRLQLSDLTPQQAAGLNRIYGTPLREPDEIEALYGLVGGHPYLVQRGLGFAANHSDSAGAWAALEASAVGEEGPFAEHLRRMLLMLGRSPDLCECVREVLRGRPCPTMESFYRLRSSGILTGGSPQEARPRCRLYAECLSRQLL